MAHLWLRSTTKIFFDARLRFSSEEIFNDVNADRKEVNQCSDHTLESHFADNST